MADHTRESAGGEHAELVVDGSPRRTSAAADGPPEAEAGPGRAPASARLAVAAFAAAGALVSGGVHLYLLGQGFGTIHVIGPLFWLNVIAGGLAGLLLVRWDHWLPQAFALGFGALSLAALYVSATRGLYGVHENLGGESEIVAQVSEFAVLLGSAALLARTVPAALERAKRGRRWH